MQDVTDSASCSTRSLVRDMRVQALLALDEHPALHAIEERYLDKAWRQAQVDDQKEVARATEFLSHLGSDEPERRVDEAEQTYDPRDEEPEPQECPRLRVPHLDG